MLPVSDLTVFAKMLQRHQKPTKSKVTNSAINNFESANVGSTRHSSRELALCPHLHHNYNQI